MAMKKLNFARHVLIGLLAGALLMPSMILAQWTVYDPAQYAIQVKKKIEEANRWIETVNQYARMYENAVQQVTTLGGVLKAADDLVAKQRNAIGTMSNIGQTIRGAYQLKNQLELLVISRMRALKTINERLHNGIFDPDADMRDFEEYLRNSVGRSSQDTVANLERLIRMDNQLRRMNEDLEKARAGRAEAVKQRIAAEKLRDAELDKPESERCAPCLATLIQKVSNCDLLIAHYDSEITQLECQIEDRKKKYNMQMDERVKFGEQVQSMSKAWSRFNDSLDELQRALSKY